MRALYSDILLRRSIREGTVPEVPNAYKYRYYEGYIQVERLETSRGNMYFIQGVSGTPLRTGNGQVAAVISNIDGKNFGLAIPAKEVAALLEEINTSSEKSK
jgi:hypothetical protein